MAKGSESPLPQITGVEQGSNPAAPSAGRRLLFPKADGWYDEDDAGAVTGPFAVGGGGGGSLSSLTADLATAQTIAAASTPTDVTGCSVSCAAGTWLLLGRAVFKRGSSDFIGALNIADGSNNYLASAVSGGISTAIFIRSVFTACIVTPGSTTTYKLRVQTSAGTTATVEKHDNTLGGQGTGIIAIKLA